MVRLCCLRKHEASKRRYREFTCAPSLRWCSWHWPCSQLSITTHIHRDFFRCSYLIILTRSLHGFPPTLELTQKQFSFMTVSIHTREHSLTIMIIGCRR